MEIFEFTLETVSNLLNIVIPIILAFALYYLKGRAENMATKDDIGDITRRIEGAKLEYSKQIEEYKHEMIKKYEYDKVLIDIKIDIFRSIISIKKKLILAKNELRDNYPNLNTEIYEEMQNVMIHVASIANLEPEILSLNNALNNEYNKFTSHLMQIKSQGGNSFSYDSKVFESILDRLQFALVR